MTLLIIGILLLGYLLIATENITNVNKAAVAIFACTVGWVLYISYGTDFVMSRHPKEYLDFLAGAPASSVAVKEFIGGSIFLKYLGKACEIVLFLLATRTIVEILDSNGCFEFISQMLGTRNSQKLLWTLGLTTLVISANLDNFTTAVMMLVVMRKLVHNRRQRLIYGSAIVVAANCGGAMTVIGTPAGLMLWNDGLVTASSYFLTLVIPCLLAWIIPTWWMGRMLSERVDSDSMFMPFRGDDARLPLWKKLLMLCWGIGGLWFIPTFHNITRLSPFLGALCVLSVLWVMNEIFNRRLLNMDSMSEERVPKVFYYGSRQIIFFVLGIILVLGVVKETGAMAELWDFLQINGATDWMMALGAGVTSTVLDNFATAAGFFMLHPAGDTNGAYWSMMAYMSAVGGNVLTTGSIAGLALANAERLHVGWYFKNVGWKAMVGALVGFAVLLLLVM